MNGRLIEGGMAFLENGDLCRRDACPFATTCSGILPFDLFWSVCPVLLSFLVLSTFLSLSGPECLSLGCFFSGREIRRWRERKQRDEDDK